MGDKIQLLEWDSQFFQVKTGRIILKTGSELETILNVAAGQGYGLIYIFSKMELTTTQHDHFTGVDVGGHVELECDIRTIPAVTDETEKKEYKLCEYTSTTASETILGLARLSGELSRFNTDKMISDYHFNELYKLWIQRTLRNPNNRSLYTYQEDGSTLGIISAEWATPISRVDLLSVDQAARGQGIAKKLIRHLISEAHSQDIHTLSVKTQMINTKARSLYESQGFKEKESLFLYHFHAKQRQTS